MVNETNCRHVRPNNVTPGKEIFYKGKKTNDNKKVCSKIWLKYIVLGVKQL